jgi:hypothetical protein
MCVSTGAPPILMPIVQLGIHNQTGVISIKATIAEKHTTLMDKPSAHCKVYKDDQAGFNTCSQNFFFNIPQEKNKLHTSRKSFFLIQVGVNCSNCDCSKRDCLTLLAGNQLLDMNFENCSNWIKQIQADDEKITTAQLFLSSSCHTIFCDSKI